MSGDAPVVGRCATCGHASFPLRAACPRCLAGDLGAEAAPEGVVEHVTRVRPSGSSAVGLAEVRTAQGPCIVALAPPGLQAGQRVQLVADADQTVAVPAAADGG
jgi:uncharacterized OB-fold protein